MSKTDKDLLMMAAKAADMGCTWLDDSDCMFWDGLPSMGIWSPLTDDGDALRLAVKLNLEIAQACYSKDLVDVYSKDDNPITEFFNDDKYAATRRAIVRAAAAIGEKM